LRPQRDDGNRMRTAAKKRRIEGSAGDSRAELDEALQTLPTAFRDLLFCIAVFFGRVALAELAAAGSRLRTVAPVGASSSGRSTAPWPLMSLSAADSDKDGFLSVEELRARAKEHFATRDANGDGALTLAEVGERGWARLKVADKNGDARLTFAELSEARASGTLKGAGHGHKEARRGAPVR
jgi:hypothetical protein